MKKKLQIGTIGHIDHGKTTIAKKAQEVIELGAKLVDNTKPVPLGNNVELNELTPSEMTIEDYQDYQEWSFLLNKK